MDTVFIPRSGLGTIFGVPGSGKTYWAVSPSHPVGLELRNMVLPSIPQTLVIIPHGGLRTFLQDLDEEAEVAICLHPTRWAWNEYVLDLLEDEEIYKSPSHTVGLELKEARWSREMCLISASPSHTVGLEQVYRRTRALAGDFVIIPHGGLGTRSLTK